MRALLTLSDPASTAVRLRELARAPGTMCAESLARWITAQWGATFGWREPNGADCYTCTGPDGRVRLWLYPFGEGVRMTRFPPGEE